MADLPIPYSECPVCESAEEHYADCPNERGEFKELLNPDGSYPEGKITNARWSSS